MLYLWVKAFHIVAMVAWFAGLFYLPRLFVYHSECQDEISIKRFKIMQYRLYYGITWPAALLTTFLGMFVLYLNPVFLKQGWMHAKLGLVMLLWGYHFLCGSYLRQFSANSNTHTSRFFRLFNEVPTLFLISIVILVTVKPF